MPRTHLWTILFLFIFVASGCGGGFRSISSSGTTTFAEPAYCSTVTSYSPSITVTANATYFYRPTVYVGGSDAYILSGNPVSDNIPGAEVIVKNSNGEIVQCSFTDESGNISLSLPKSAGTYSLVVQSRALNNLIKVSVLNEINANQPYSISKSFSLAGTETTFGAGTLTAYARKSESAAIEGGAFHILKAIFDANKYIRVQTSQPSWVAEKVTVYWQAGFNPYSYLGFPNSLISFYSSGKRQLFILGGKDGNVSTADTDHFDRAVIIHEYGHFLEDVYAKSDSPGGSHNGNFIIDPRLAWSEGWAYFFQGAVQSINRSVDTAGFCNDSVEGGVCTLMTYLKHDQSGGTASLDAVSVNGEGTFREVSIVRTLYKTMATLSTVHPHGAAIPFSEIWNIFSNTSTGFASSQVRFRNVAPFLGQLNTVINSSYSGSVTAWNNLLSNEKQILVSTNYADGVTSAATCAKYPKNLAPVVDGSIGGSVYSNKLYSNDTYQYYYNGSSNAKITVSYTQATGTVIDLDLVVYKESHQYYEQQDEQFGYTNSTVAVRSARANPTFESGEEFVNMNGLPAGFYLINIRAKTFGKITAELTSGSANYTLKETINSTENQLCPNN